MSSASALHRRLAGVLVAAVLCLLGGVATGTAASADTGHLAGIVKYCTPPQPKPLVEVETLTGAPSCETPTVTVGTITTTTPYVWAPATWTPWGWVWDWVLGRPSVVEDLHEATLPAVDAALCDAGPKPEARTETLSFTAAPDCDSPDVMLGDVVTTTEYVLDVETRTWVLGEPVTVDNRRPAGLTEAERLACLEQGRPEPRVESLAYTGAPSCATPEVMLGTVTTTTPWVWDADRETWVPGEPTVLDERAKASLTPAELAACVPQTPTPPEAQAARSVPTATSLALTGGSALAPTLIALGLVALGGLTLLARRRLRA